MNRNARVDALFDRALDLSADRVSRFLDEHCAGDPQLRADVEDLLRFAAAPAPTLDWPAFAPRLLNALDGSDPPLEVPEGFRIGVWRIVREIGRGGMGIVYLVERADGQFEQKAALKLVRAVANGAGIAWRLERERHILASLAHPTVATLLDGGTTDDGRPFLVMEYVDGRPIDRYCDDARLAIPQRLALFEEVCRGIQHAHRKLVVHRDIKPSNILVTDAGDVKVLDFGIAKLLSPTEPPEGDAVTQTMTRVLTPEYASPEQVRGERVAVASDVYQLGLLLYELLTGLPARRILGTTAGAVERAVCETVPERPSSRVGSAPWAAPARRLRPAALARTLKGDLDTIVLCALQKEPDRRYASVGALLEDVARYRSGLPIQARKNTPGYRAGKFVGRHRVAIASALSLVTAAVLVAWAVVGPRWQAARERARADQVERLIARLIVPPRPSSSSSPPTAADYVDRAATLVRHELQGHPGSQGRLLTDIGRVYLWLGRYQAALDVLQPALVLRAGDAGAASLDVAETLVLSGSAYHYLGRYNQAEASLQRALSIRGERLGPADPLTLSTAQILGDLLHTRGRLIDAERVLRIATVSLRGYPDREDALARALRDLGNVLRDRGELAEATDAYQEALAILRRRHADPDPRIVESEIFLARLLIMRSDFQAADRLLLENIARIRRIYQGTHPLAGMAWWNLGSSRTAQGRFDEAASNLDEAVAVYRGSVGTGNPLITRVRASQAELALRRGRPREAAAIAREALDEFDKADMRQHPAALDACGTLGEALVALAQPEGAAERLRACLPDAERLFVAADPRLLRLHATLHAATGPRRAVGP